MVGPAQSETTDKLNQHCGSNKRERDKRGTLGKQSAEGRASNGPITLKINERVGPANRRGGQTQPRGKDFLPWPWLVEGEEMLGGAGGSRAFQLREFNCHTTQRECETDGGITMPVHISISLLSQAILLASLFIPTEPSFCRLCASTFKPFSLSVSLSLSFPLPSPITLLLVIISLLHTPLSLFFLVSSLHHFLSHNTLTTFIHSLATQ